MPGQIKRLEGEKFGRLTVLSLAGIDDHGAIWSCVCSCGGIKEAASRHLRSGNTQSCGCMQVEAGRATATHGMSNTPTYNSWVGMHDRCKREDHRSWKDYGGRGIYVCARWEKFENFLIDMGIKPSPKHSIDRIDNNGIYDPKNCQWSLMVDQQRNKRSNRLINLHGKEIPITVACEILGIQRGMVYQRIRHGWPDHDALHIPPHGTRG